MTAFPGRAVRLTTAIAMVFALSAQASPGQWQVHTTAQGDPVRFAKQVLPAPSAAGQPFETETAVFVDSSKRFQKLLGFGGAITDATAEVYARLTPEAQQQFLTAYFDPGQGLGYSVVRTSIHSSDFSSASYTYVSEGDRSLRSFSIEHDRQFRIPLLRSAVASAKSHGNALKLFVSPWSAPGWMKSNGSMLGGGTLLPGDRDLWARYMVKFIQAYEKEGLPIWGLTVQNEPMAKQRWESMIFSAKDETDFVAENLGPALKKAKLGDKKLIVWDHNRDLLPQRAAHILSDPRARPYIWGIGFHWYETWTGGEPMHRNVASVHQRFPTVNLLMTEATVEQFDPAKLQLWANGERYGSQIIGDLVAGAVGWVDWNMLLDARGGPNHVGNYCFAPLHASDDGQLIFTPTYAFLGHFSRYIRPQAQRISATASRSSLDTVAFRNADGSVAVVVMNKTDKAQRYRLSIDHKEVAVDIPAHAIQTVLR
jgi:glucosylceramidase